MTAEVASRPGAAAERAGEDLTLTGVTVRFGGLLALDEVTVTVPATGVVGVIGPNGAGKTTLFNVVCGFVRPDAGTIIWRGRRLAGVRPHQLARLGIARTLQGVGLFPGLSVVENVAVGGSRHARAGLAAAVLGLPSSDRDERRLRGRALAALDRLDVADLAEELPERLPFAAQKRVAIARALVADPTLLLLDEPAVGLSEAEIDRLANLILDLRATTAVMLVEHHLDLVLRVCDAVTVLNFGRVLARGVPAEVVADPVVAEAYLGAEPPGPPAVPGSAATPGPDPGGRRA